MMSLCVLSLTVFVLCGVQVLSARGGLRGMFPDKYPPMLLNGIDPGKPLFLTPYVEKGQFDMGKCCIACGRKKFCFFVVVFLHLACNMISL